jgi:glutamate-1-semialdehyde 2,1-aminomutase
VRSIRDLERSVKPLLDLFYFHMLDRRVWIARRGMINLSLPVGDAECDHLVRAVQGFVDSCNGMLPIAGAA